MDNNRLLMIVLAFVVGYMASGMMKQMCGGRLVEGRGILDLIEEETMVSLEQLEQRGKQYIYDEVEDTVGIHIY